MGDAYGIQGGQRGYLLQNNPNIQPLKSRNGVATELKLQLAINTAQTGRVFQDRLVFMSSFVNNKW